MTTRLLAPLLVLCCGSCTGATLARAPVKPLERAVLLREAASDGWHGISNADPMSAEVLRVVNPVLVDAEARVEILPDTAQLQAVAAAEGARNFRLQLQAFVDRPGVDPVPLHLPGYDDVDSRELRLTPQGADGEFPATSLDLSRTIVRSGDRVLLRTTLLDSSGSELGDGMDTHLRVTQLGWNSAYHPSVVLARPFTPEVGDAEFRFTPGVAWLHSYTPRHDEQGGWADWMRATNMSLGPHAMLLQFDTEDEVEIGLGVTMGFWSGVLQLGFGYNLMANDGQDRQYFYVGSSMITLAQAAERSFGSLVGL